MATDFEAYTAAGGAGGRLGGPGTRGGDAPLSPR